jgi:hypothetical protein
VFLFFKARLAQASSEALQERLDRVILPRFPRALFSVDQLSEQLDETIRADFDLKAVRKAVAELFESLA